MDTVNLCIDIGNTSSKAAAYCQGELVAYHKPFDESHLQQYRLQEANVLVSATGNNIEIEKHLIASEYLSHTTPLPIALDYDSPSTLGSDRIAAAVGAYRLSAECSWLIADLGTCLTLDVLHNGVFCGGLISPGVQMRFQAMHTLTAKLPLATADYTVIFPGKNTLQSLQVGVCQSIGYEIEGYIRELNLQYTDLQIVDCSSMSIGFGKEVKNKIFARPNLVLSGLNHIIEYNVQK